MEDVTVYDLVDIGVQVNVGGIVTEIEVIYPNAVLVSGGLLVSMDDLFIDNDFQLCL